jgi:hypothetical protein
VGFGCRWDALVGVVGCLRVEGIPRGKDERCYCDWATRAWDGDGYRGSELSPVLALGSLGLRVFVVEGSSDVWMDLALHRHFFT